MKYLALVFIGLSGPASAETVTASANGFEVRESVNLVVKPDAAMSAFLNVAGWWDADHTYSGDSANLSIAPTIGGCFCERFPKGGGVEHMHVTLVDPGKRIVFTGSLGPLLYEATTGVMDVQVKTIAGGAQLTLDYRVAGFFRGGAEDIAQAVDEVLAGQMKRYRTFVTNPTAPH